MSKTDWTKSLWVRRSAMGLALYLLACAAARLTVPWAVGRALREVPRRLPGFTAKIDEARFDPFRLSLTVRGFSLSQAKLGEIASCEEFFASFQPLDLLRLAVGLRHLRFTRPRLVAVIAADGTSVLDALPKSAPSSSTAAVAASTPFVPRVVVHHLLIERAAIELDSRLPRAPQRLAADPINLALDNLSTIPEAKGSYTFSARTDRGESLTWSGKLVVRPPSLAGEISVKNADLSRESTAAPRAPAAVTAGRLDASTRYAIAYSSGVLTADLSDSNLAVRGLYWRLRASTAPARGPFSLGVGPGGVHLRARLPAAVGDKVSLSAQTRVAGRGSVRLDAAAMATPSSGRATLRVVDFPLAPFSPLAPAPTELSIDSGAVTLTAELVAASPRDAGVTADFSLDGFSLSDRASRRTLARLRRFAISGARAALKSRRASVDLVELDDPFLRVARDASGLTNIQRALGLSVSTETAASPAPPASASASARKPASSPAWRARLKRFAMRGAALSVEDSAVAPPFALSVRAVRADLKDLTSDARSTASFSAAGLVETAPFDASGSVRLSSAAAWITAKVKTQGVQLSAFTPYAIAVIGYKLDRGTLNLDLDESLAAREVDSRNKIVVDDLTLGQKVDSPTALRVPVKLGLAILKDRRGVIDLDVPISGSLDDPKFRLLPVILKTLVNLIVKAATSPFDALSAAMGGGADLGHVAFAAGSPSLAPAAEAGLDKVLQALNDRPSLSVGARGVAVKADALALGDLALRRRLRGPDPGPEALTPKEEKKLLALAASLAVAPAADAASARAALDARLAGSDADLRSLALARAAAIQSYLLSKGLAPARFFSLDPSGGAQDAGAPLCALQLDVR